MGDSGILEPVRSPPDVCGVKEERLINSKNPTLALADPSLALANLLEDAYVEPGTAIQMSTYVGEFN